MACPLFSVSPDMSPNHASLCWDSLEERETGEPRQNAALGASWDTLKTLNGAEGRTRTDTVSLPADFELCRTVIPNSSHHNKTAPWRALRRIRFFRSAPVFAVDWYLDWYLAAVGTRKIAGIPAFQARSRRRDFPLSAMTQLCVMTLPPLGVGSRIAPLPQGADAPAAGLELQRARRSIAPLYRAR